MNRLVLMSVGMVDPDMLGCVAEAAARQFGVDVVCEPDPLDPAPAWDQRRLQYSSSLILRQVAECSPPDHSKMLAMTEVDLFIPMLSFIYGQAQLGGSAAIVSLARLRQEFYGFPAEADLLRERARKEALHELGHTVGLVHCADVGCVMALATNIRQVDLKSESFCHVCRALLGEAGLSIAEQGTYSNHEESMGNPDR